jgi:tyrosinase
MWATWYVLLSHLDHFSDALAHMLVNNRQVLGGAKRYTDIGKGNYAHETWANEPPTPLCTLSQAIDMGYAAPSTTFADVMSTTGGELCYFYI